jgi:hypothetical protein
MKIITIKTQEQLDKLPLKFDEFTTIEIRAGTDGAPIIIRMNSENSRAVLYGNSHAELLGSSSAELWENSRAVLWDCSRAALWDNSRAELWGNSRADLCDNSSAELWGNSSAELCDNSSALLRENSSAELHGNSRVSAYDFSIVNVFSEDATIDYLADHSTASLYGVRPKIEKKDDTARVVRA